MIDLIKKIMFTGIGIASLTKDKIEELGKEIAEKGTLSEKEGKELLDELLKKSEEAKKDAASQVEKFVADSLTKVNVATREDLLNLEKKVDELASLIKDRKAAE